MENKKRSISSRTFAVLLAVMLVIGCAAGGTIAWLISSPDAVVNTFTYGNINIELGELTGDTYKIIPGVDINKDPKVTVKSGSEACWLFVKVEEENWPTFKETGGETLKIQYQMEAGWKQDKGTAIPPNVYYREVGAATADMSFNVLKDNKITVSESLTKDEIDSLTGTAVATPKLTFTAYAVQKDGIADAATAWAKANPTT